ncbi:Ankyrin repeat-containing protein 7 [Elsinoe fawcettii]|nr:Ankyrin repeat-containing protein 7 [Elsinoe fawcettii]
MAAAGYGRNDYEVGIICALGTEEVAVLAMLDERHAQLRTPTADQNRYRYGTMAGVHVVIACLPAGTYGKPKAAKVATNMSRSFEHLTLVLMVGVGGGVWSRAHDIRLGDVVVSEPTGPHPGLVEWDRGRTESAFVRTGALNPPSDRATNVLQDVKVSHKEGDVALQDHIATAIQRRPGLDRAYHAQPDRRTDRLFLPESRHRAGQDCSRCDIAKLVKRASRRHTGPKISYGNIASGDKVVKNAYERDQIAQKEQIICFEMEAAGVATVYSNYLVIRGICDYADSHKQKDWQPWAAMVAAAYAKDLLRIMKSNSPTRDTTERNIYHRRDSLQQLDMDTFHVSRQGSFPSQQNRKLITAGDDVENITLKPKISLEDCLRSLAFEDMRERENNIKARLSGTCEWFWQHQDFQKWTSNDGILWLVGKPGSGKSTIMKSLYDRLGEDKSWSGIVVAHYFLSSGESVQKSLLGCYRALLHQLVRVDDQAKAEFTRRCQRKCDHETKSMVDLTWSEAELVAELKTSIDNLAARCPVTLLVDALDECENEKSERALRELAQTLCSTTRSARFPTRICISTRPFPQIVTTSDLAITSDESNGDDIDLAVSDLFSTHGFQEGEEIRLHINERAAGVFSWAVLAADRAVQMNAEGYSLSAILREVNAIPTELRDVYKSIIAKVPVRDVAACLHIMQWLCHGIRTFRIQDLVVALVMDESCIRAETVQATIETNEGACDDEKMIKRIRSLSRGLIGVRTINGYDYFQLIHSTVHGYMLEEGIQSLYDRQTRWICGGDLRTASHHRLLKACLRMITFPEILRHADAYSRPWPLGETNFAVYALENWFSHAFHAVKDEKTSKDILSYFKWPDQRISQRVCKLTDFCASSRLRDYKPPYERWSRKPRLSHNLLCLSIEYGIWPLALHCLEALPHGADIIYSRTANCSLSEICALFGQLEVLQLLVKRGLTLAPSKDLGQQHLHLAAGEGHVYVMEYLLAEGLDINGLMKEDITPLHNAANGGHLDACRFLINHGADLNVKSIIQWTAMTFAACHGHIQVICQLLEAGADIACGASTLVTALREGHKGTVDILLEAGAPTSGTGFGGDGIFHVLARHGIVDMLSDRRLHLETFDSDLGGWHGNTPLMYALALGHFHVANWLLHRGASMTRKNGDGMTPLHFIADCGKRRAGQLHGYDDAASLPTDVSDGYTDPGKQPESEYVEMARLLISRGADVAALDDRKRPSLSWAIQSRCLEMSRLMLRAAVDSSNMDEKAWLWVAREAAEVSTPEILHECLKVREIYCRLRRVVLVMDAVFGNNLPNLKFLTDLGADVNRQSRYADCTALHWAVQVGHIDIVTHLLDNGADVNHCMRAGRQPLHGAIAFGQPALVQILLERGAEVNGNARFPVPPLELAIRRRSPEFVDLLLKYGADPNTPIAIHGRTMSLQPLRLPDIDDKGPPDDDRKETMLHLAGLLSKYGVAQKLIDAGADVDGRNSLGDTALMFAVYYGQLELIDILLAAGADLDAQADNGDTALIMAVHYDRVNIFALLLEKGADPSMVNKWNFSALHQCIRFGAMGILRLLQNVAGCAEAPDPNAYPLIALYDPGRLGFLDDLPSVFTDGLHCARIWQNPIRSAAIRDETTAFQYFHNRFGKDEYPDRCGASLFQLALRCGDLTTAERAICDTSLTHRDLLGLSAVHYAAQGCGGKAIRWLRDYNCHLDFSLVDNSGWTALHWAAWSDAFRVYDWLCEIGMDPKVENRDGQTAEKFMVDREERLSVDADECCDCCGCELNRDKYACETCHNGWFSLCTRCYEDIGPRHKPHEMVFKPFSIETGESGSKTTDESASADGDSSGHEDADKPVEKDDDKAASKSDSKSEMEVQNTTQAESFSGKFVEVSSVP